MVHSFQHKSLPPTTYDFQAMSGPNSSVIIITMGIEGHLAIQISKQGK